MQLLIYVLNAIYNAKNMYVKTCILWAIYAF